MPLRFLLFVLFHFFLIHSFAQETNILTCKRKQRGLYRNFAEFKQNNPSDTISPFDTKMPNKHPDRYTLFKVEDGKKEKVKQGVWGFCDGKDVFVCVSAISPGNWFVKIYNFGFYCVFTDLLNSGGGGLAGALLQQELNKEKKYFDIAVIDFTNGEIKVVNKKNIQMMLLDDEELSNQYKEDPKGKNKLLDYILQFNEHLKSKYPVSSSE